MKTVENSPKWNVLSSYPSPWVENMEYLGNADMQASSLFKSLNGV